MNKADAIRAMLDGKWVRHVSWPSPWKITYDFEIGQFVFEAGDLCALHTEKNDNWELYTPPQETVRKYAWAVVWTDEYGSSANIFTLAKDDAAIRNEWADADVSGVTFHKLKVDDDGHIYVEVVK